MACVYCKYQLCWLCEGEYKYGHYESGKCQGQQFIKADKPKKVSNYNFNNHRNDRNNKCNFGIHRIFKCIYRNGLINLYFSENVGNVLLVKYIHILLFWLLGIYIIFYFICDEFAYRNLIDINTRSRDYFYFIVYLTGIALWVPFQIAFICLMAPFILICLIYHKFFDIFLIFLGFKY